MSLKSFSQKKHDHLTAKRVEFSVRVTTNLNGRLKNLFIDDALHRNDMESCHARNIIELYYSVLSEFPDLESKEFPEIKYAIISRMKR